MSDITQNSVSKLECAS